MTDLLAQLHDSIAIVAENKRLRIENKHLRETIDLRDQEIARLRPFKRDLTQPWDASQR